MGHVVAEEARNARAAAWTKPGAMAACNVRIVKAKVIIAAAAGSRGYYPVGNNYIVQNIGVLAILLRKL